MGFGSRPVSMVDHFEPLCVILAVVTCPSAIAAVRTWSARIASEVTEPVASFAAISHILLNTSVMYNSPTTLHSKGFLRYYNYRISYFFSQLPPMGGVFKGMGLITESSPSAVLSTLPGPSFALVTLSSAIKHRGGVRSDATCQ